MWLFERDKITHMLLGYVASDLAFRIGYAINRADPYWVITLQLVSVAIVAIGTEVYQYQTKKGTADFKDIIATFVGYVAQVATAIISAKIN